MQCRIHDPIGSHVSHCHPSVVFFLGGGEVDLAHRIIDVSEAAQCTTAQNDRENNLFLIEIGGT